MPNETDSNSQPIEPEKTSLPDQSAPNAQPKPEAENTLANAEVKPESESMTHRLIKTPEEIFAEMTKKNMGRLKLMVFLGTIIVMIIVSAYVLKSGVNLQGNLPDITEEHSSSNFELCDLDEYKPLEVDECQEISKDQCELIDRLKLDPLKYSIDADTLKQDWWQEDCEVEIQGFGSPQIEPEYEPLITDIEEPEIIETNQPIDCGKAKADASIYTDKGFIDTAYETQVSQLTAPHCHPEYNVCQQNLASAVAAQSYMTFAESITRSIVQLKYEFEESADAFYENPSCYHTQEECSRIKTSGVTPFEPEESLPLSLIAPTPGDPSGTSEPSSAISSFSQDALEYNIEKAISDNSLFTEKQFYERYCVPKPDPEAAVTQPVPTSEIPPAVSQPTPKVKRST